MAEYEDVAEYLGAVAENQASAGIPLPLVAEHFGVSSAAVTGMIKSGKLEALRIGRSTLVSAKSILKYERDRQNEVDAVERYLWSAAQAGVEEIFYEPVMSKIGLSTQTPAHRTRIGQILGDLSEKSHEEHGVLLSVIVHRKKAGRTMPGSGFFDLAKRLGLKWTDDSELIASETQKLLAKAERSAKRVVA